MDSPPGISQPVCRRSAFTLIELLLVLAIIVLLIGMAAPAFKSIGSSNRLTAAGNRVVNLVNFARQNSTSKNAMTALIVVTDPNSINRNRMLATFELVPPADGSLPATTDWHQVGKWEVLETGVIAEQPITSAAFTTSDKQPTPAFPTLQYQGSPIAGYNYAIFMPSGGLLVSNTLQLRLSEGFFPQTAASQVATAPIYTRLGAGGSSPVNFYNIFVLNATGRVKIDRQ